MNKKFQLVAIEAKMNTTDFDAGSYYMATLDWMQTLCKLILRKCAGKVECILTEGGETQGDLIRKHFVVAQ